MRFEIPAIGSGLQLVASVENTARSVKEFLERSLSSRLGREHSDARERKSTKN
jgi:hypothetical protein